MAKENVISIFKIDTESNSLSDCDGVIVEIIKKIISRSNKKVGIKRQKNTKGYEFSDYTLLPIRDVDTYGFTVDLYHSSRIVPNAWDDFLANILNDQEEKFWNRNHDFIVFVYDADSLFCFTGGIASNLVEDISDENFPREIMIRLSDPERIKQAKSRGLTGAFYARELYFRGNYSISPTEAFGSVWKDIRASIKDSIWEDADWKVMLGEKTNRDLNCDIRSSFKIRKRLDFNSAVKLVKKLKDELRRPLTQTEQEGFYFLNTIKIVKNKDEKQILGQELAKKAFTFLTSLKTSTSFDYDFCHKKYAEFLEADHYFAKRNVEKLAEWKYINSAEEVLADLKGKIDLTNLKNFTEDFSKNIKILSENDADNLKNTTGTLLEHLHGELEIGKGNKRKNYFLIDKEWCLVQDNFLELISAEFQDYIQPDIFCTIPLNTWAGGNEGPYNESYLANNNFLVGDRVTIGGIELFDLLHYNKEQVFIIQVKDGLGASTRDACSQLRNSARVIEESLKDSNHKKLKDYYNRLHNSGLVYAKTSEFKKTMANVPSEDKFVELLKNRKRTYVLAFRYGQNIDDIVKVNSNIAKFEILGLKDDIKLTNASFKLFQIKREKK